jgi:hypothetical protein
MDFHPPARSKGKVDYRLECLPRPPEAFYDISEDNALICLDTVMYETANYCFPRLKTNLLNDSTTPLGCSWAKTESGCRGFGQHPNR